MCRTYAYGHILLVGVLFALLMPGLMAMFLMAPTSEATPAGTIGNHQLSIGSHVMTPREVEEINSSIGIRQDGKSYNPLIDGHGTGLAPPTSEELAGMAGTTSVTDSVVSTGGSSASYDISAQPYFPVIGNQGSSGSCAAWAMTYYAYGYLEAKDNGWTDASTGNPAHLMSPTWTYNMVDGGTGAGTFMDTNAAVITNWGAATLKTDPFVAGDVTDWGSQAAFLEAPLHRALSYSTMTYGSATIGSIRTLIASNVPVTFAIDANQFTAGLKGDNLITAGEYTTGAMNHAQCIVGYSDTMKEAGRPDVGAFKVANSWGRSFGFNGFYWISYDTIKKIGTSGLLHATYITDRPHYQPTLIATWQFSTAPTRNSAIKVGVGPVGSSTRISPFFVLNGAASAARFPTFMALDISSLQSAYSSGTTNFYLTIGTAKTPGMMSSFRTALYLKGYGGTATALSGQSRDVPAITPCSVTVSMPSSSGAKGVPDAPAGLTVSASGSSITLGWREPSNNGGSAITGYRVYRGTATGNETLLSSVPSSVRSFADSTAVGGTAYHYSVSALNSIGEGAEGASVHIVTAVSGAPGPFTMTATPDNGRIVLAWTVPSSSTPISSFDLMRKDAFGEESLIAMLPSSSTGYTDMTAMPSTSWAYRMVVVSSAGLTSTPWVTATAVPAVGEQNANGLGISNHDVPVIGFGALILVTIGTIVSAAYVRSRESRSFD